MTPTRYGTPELREDLHRRRDGRGHLASARPLAYALIAGIDPRFGLFSAIVVTPRLRRRSAFVVTSRSTAPPNAISLVVFSALAYFDPDARVDAYEATFLLALMAGAFQIAIAVFRLGDLTRYISRVPSVLSGSWPAPGY